jgi:hypothetical protein
LWGEINEYANEGQQRGPFAGIDAMTGCCGYVCASFLLGGAAQLFFSGAVSATLERKLVIISSIILTHTFSHAIFAPQRHSELVVVCSELVVVSAPLRTVCCASAAPNWLSWTGAEVVGGYRRFAG